MIETPMPLLSAVARDWWVLALRGVIAVLFGIMAFVWPALTLAVLILLWGAFALVEGIPVVTGALLLLLAFRLRRLNGAGVPRPAL